MSISRRSVSCLTAEVPVVRGDRVLCVSLPLSRKHWRQPPGWMQDKPPPAPPGLSCPWTSFSWRVRTTHKSPSHSALSTCTPSLNTHAHTLPQHTCTHPPSTHMHTPSLNTHAHTLPQHTCTHPPSTHMHTRHVATPVPQKPHCHQVSPCYHTNLSTNKTQFILASC